VGTRRLACLRAAQERRLRASGDRPAAGLGWRRGRGALEGRWWAGDIERQAIGSAHGTLTAALVLVLGGALLGAIRDVPAEALIAAGAALASAIAAGAGITRWARLAEGAAAPLPDPDRLREILRGLIELGVVEMTEAERRAWEESERKRKAEGGGAEPPAS
jgi:hypothetical protein